MFMVQSLERMDVKEIEGEGRRKKTGATAPETIVARPKARRNTCRGRLRTHPLRAFPIDHSVLPCPSDRTAMGREPTRSPCNNSRLQNTANSTPLPRREEP